MPIGFMQPMGKGGFAVPMMAQQPMGQAMGQPMGQMQAVPWGAWRDGDSHWGSTKIAIVTHFNRENDETQFVITISIGQFASI